MSKITKTAVVSVVGRPNVGKSTLTNKLVGQKVAIVSSKPQTTRTRITGVLSRGETQYVLLDTPDRLSLIEKELKEHGFLAPLQPWEH